MLYCAIDLTTQSCIAVSTSEPALAFYVREQQEKGLYPAVVSTLCYPTTFPDAFVVDPAKYGF
jgi:hypothetical protein